MGSNERPDGAAAASEEVRDNAALGRFELWRDDVAVGTLEYTHLKPNRYALRHTEVGEEHQHQGVGGAMVRRVLEEVHTRGGTVTAICPFVVDFVARHAEYADLIDPHHPGYRDRTEAEAARAATGG